MRLHFEVERSSYLSLGEPEGGGQLGSFGQSQILRPLETPFQLLNLEAGIDGSRLPHLLAFAVDPRNFPVFNLLLNFDL